jgi:hypothetical protein
MKKRLKRQRKSKMPYSIFFDLIMERKSLIFKFFFVNLISIAPCVKKLLTFFKTTMQPNQLNFVTR